MATTIANLDRAMLRGKAAFQKFHRQNQERFFAPLIQAQIVQAIRDLPPEVIAAIRQEHPEALQDIEKRFIPGGKL